MILVLDNEPFESALLQKLADACNNTTEDIKIYLCSGGGRVSILKAMLHLINSASHRFELIGFHSLYSCAFEFYLKAECKKDLLVGTMGLCHLGITSIDFNDKGKVVWGNDEGVIQRQKQFHLPEIRKMMEDCEFHPKEKKKVESGADLYIQYDRFKEMEAAYNKNNKMFVYL
ncbi:hypothetical protein [uncultured Chryseobacterium sp.]|uniref:hypothetical protein n=1 Tax=uncultured Chryseobacterium sp. TaxID=259322 RepID=UPI0025CFF5D1|nr:hypothetical protein [uncultured Chryseobacterium sp.]